jgi:hypothetical protein
MWLTALANTSQAPFRSAVDQDHAGIRGQRELHHHVIGRVQPPRPRDPVQLAVEHQQTDQPQPEHRHRIAHQPDDPHDLVGDAARAGWRPARPRARRPGCRRSCPGSPAPAWRGNSGRSSATGFRGADRGAQIALHRVADIDPELLPHRQVQAQLVAHRLHLRLGRAFADDRQHRVKGHHAADDEGDQQQAKKGDCQRQKAKHRPAAEGGAGARAAVGRGLGHAKGGPPQPCGAAALSLTW